jgi:hypothetical protein
MTPWPTPDRTAVGRGQPPPPSLKRFLRQHPPAMAAMWTPVFQVGSGDRNMQEPATVNIVGECPSSDEHRDCGIELLAFAWCTVITTDPRAARPHALNRRPQQTWFTHQGVAWRSERILSRLA